jgi:lipopolysaccharide heptosyltransferase I
MKVLIVRLGALGDVVHTIPAAAALRRALPDARIDWIVGVRHAPLLALVEGIDRVVPFDGSSIGAWIDAVRRLRAERYDVALDFQGLMKSAVLARASGARRVAGFSIWHLREKGARPFYSDVDAHEPPAHVIHKNLSLLSTVGVRSGAVEFPLARRACPTRETIVAETSGGRFALLNPGAAWPNKRWPPERFGEVAAFLREVRGLSVYVLWGPGEEALAREVVHASGGAARLAPPTTTSDLVEVSRSASLIVSGDTGPLHIAAAVGTPAVAIFGPTDPARNGPWSSRDVVVSRHHACRCPYERRCRNGRWCLADVETAEVTAAIQALFAER